MKRLTALAALSAALLLAPAGTAGLDVELERYHAAEREGALGGVTGRAWFSARNPDAQGSPVVGALVRLLPYSDRLVAQFEAIRGRSRQSLTAYRNAVAELRHAREEYERALHASGAGGLVRQATVSAGGDFAIDNVPAGEWIIVAEHGTPTRRASPKPPKTGVKKGNIFLPQAPILGHDTVTVWMTTVTVESSRTEHVELTERNGWVHAIEEKRSPGAAP